MYIDIDGHSDTNNQTTGKRNSLLNLSLTKYLPRLNVNVLHLQADVCKESSHTN